MYYERAKLEKMDFNNDKIEKIINSNVIDISDAIESKLREILEDVGEEFKLHYKGFLFDLEKVILRNGDISGEYDKDLFEKVLEIKLIDSISYIQETNYMSVIKKDSYLTNKYSNFITLIAGANHFHTIKYNETCLNFLQRYFNLSIEVLKEEKYKDEEEDCSIFKREFGNIQNFNHFNSVTLLVLNEESNVCTINDKTTGRIKYTLNIIV